MAQVFLKLTRPPNGQPQVGPHQWVFLRTLADISSGFCGDKTQFSFTGRQTISIPDNGNQKEVLKAKPHCSPNPNHMVFVPEHEQSISCCSCDEKEIENSA